MEWEVNASAQRGFALFTGSARCATCHLIGADHALFTDHRFHDTGVAWYAAAARTSSTDSITVQVAPDTAARLPRSAVGNPGDTRAPLSPGKEISSTGR